MTPRATPAPLPALLLAAAAGIAAAGCQPPDRPARDHGADFDVLIRGGTVVDGTGEERFGADVAIRDDRIVRVDRERSIDAGRADRVLDAEGLVVAPGFIDHHAHVQTTIHERPLAENFVRQGITTIVASIHGGDQPWPMDAYMASLDVAPNVGFFAGHTWIRREVVGMEDRAPTPDEMEHMKALVEESMRAGALGLSTGLLYVPANFAEVEEVIELARVAARHGGIYASHLRDQGLGLLDGIRELIRISDEAGLPGQVAHHKARAVSAFGMSRESLALIDSARAAGLDITHDLYPYTAASTSSDVLLPQWALAGGDEAFRERVADPDTRERIEAESRRLIGRIWAGDDLSRIQFRTLPSDPSYVGRTMADLARDRGMPVDVDTGVGLAVELQLEGGFTAIYHSMSEEDVIRIMQHPWAMFETDGDGLGYGVGYPHPRSYGAFPRVLARYVRELEVVELEDVIRRMTSLSARQVGQLERGEIREGMLADVTVFDPETIQDRATFTDPHRYSTGVIHVVVNGVPVLRNASLTGATPGRVLKGPARPDAVTAADGARDTRPESKRSTR